MTEKNKSEQVAKAISKAPPEVKKLLKESELIMGGLLQVSGQLGDLVIKSKGKTVNAKWVGKKVKTKKVSETEAHGITRAYGEIKKGSINKVALVIPPKKPFKPQQAA